MKTERLNLQQIQVEQLAAIGAALRQAREDQGQSIEQMAAKTLVQRRLLQAIEAGDLAQLPEIIYVRGFIKRYANELGLEGDQLSDLLPAAPAIPEVRHSWKELPAAQLRPLHLYALYLLLIVAAVSGLSYLLRQSAMETAVESNLNTPTELDTTQDTTPATGASPSPAPATSSPVPSPTSATGNQPIRVQIKLTDQSWIRIVVDGNTKFEGILQEGEQRTLTAEKQLTIRAGNAGGVMVAFNGRDAEQLGAPGAVKEVTFSEPQNTAQLSSALADASSND